MASRSTDNFITFYSYKGGSGRTMLLANVAWILASNGKRVLMIDWDLEAPGLHRYFHPFLDDPELSSSEGLIDFVTDFAVEAVTPRATNESSSQEWYEPFTNILRYAVSINWPFSKQGRLDLVPAGRQNHTYSTRVNSFDWKNFYERLGGGTFLDAVKKRLRKEEEYDYVLIDSRTGVSDTSGICTIQMPDILVICFTLNRQSIEGASGIAKSIRERRDSSTLHIFPVPTRTEAGEKKKLDTARGQARLRFAPFLPYSNTGHIEKYWADVEVPYQQYYAYEEILAVFGDRPLERNTILAAAERLTAALTNEEISRLDPIEESMRIEVLSQFEWSAQDINIFEFDVFLSHASHDKPAVRELAKRLQQDGLKVWFDEWFIRPGDRIDLVIEKGLEKSRCLVLIMSPNAFGSEWGDLERRTVFFHDPAVATRRFIPLLLADCKIPDSLKRYDYIDYRKKSEAAYLQLLSVCQLSLKRRASRTGQSRGGVFISYSHKDEEFLQAFRVHLKPWEERELLEVWSDERIELSQDWHQEIQQALESTAVVVLLISPDFLASDYIRDHELPLLLHDCEEGHIALVCLYLRHSIVEDDDAAIEVELSSGQRVPIHLTKYQGLNSPQAVVAELDTNGRDKLYAKASSDLRQLVDRQIRKTRQPPSGERFELTVQFESRASQLIRSYFHQYGRIAQYRSSWQWPSNHESGQALFETLFGPQDQYKEVLSILFGSDVPPIRHPVRVRIQTNAPTLAELPWVDTTWEENSLFEDGWTFELIAAQPQDAVEDFPDILLKAPCPVLMIASGTESDTLSHHRALEERLKHAWPFYHEPPQRVGSWKALEDAWQRRRPRIVYYYGPAEHDGKTLRLLLDTGQGGTDKRPAIDLVQIWGSDPPQIVFFNFVGNPVSTGTSLSALHAPLIVTQNETDSAKARRTALEWLHAVLEGGEDTDPVWALHQYGLANAAAWGAYGTWRTRTANEPAKDTIARLLLDRKAQRALGQAAVSELVRDGDRRLCCLLAYGSQGNLVELFAEQLFEHLRRNAKIVAQVYRVPMRLPTPQSFDVTKIAFEVRRTLGLNDQESFGTALAARKPRGPGRARPVLLLDWGVRGTTEDNRLSMTALEAWLAFCSQQLSAECPKDIRLVSCLSVQIAKERHETLEQSIKSLRAEPRFRDSAFRLELLPPLEQIEASDLADFLDGRGNSSCPDDLISLMPELIVTKTGGQFSDTVDLVEQAERVGWYTLYDELAAELGQSQLSSTTEDELL